MWIVVSSILLTVASPLFLRNCSMLYKDIWGYSQGKSILNMDLDIWVVGTLNQLTVRDSYTEIEISKK